MTNVGPKEDNSALSKRERTVIAALLALAGVLTIADVYEDWADGAPLSHIIPEVFIIFLSIGVALYLMRHLLVKRHKVIQSSKAEIDLARQSAQSWQNKAESLSKGITDAISEQFDEWSLSPAEQDVSFLLLKGMSIQEIAEIRKTSERTVRQQASEIYKKSGLTGRAQLSAFFLEDMFER